MLQEQDMSERKTELVFITQTENSWYSRAALVKEPAHTIIKLTTGRPAADSLVSIYSEWHDVCIVSSRVKQLSMLHIEDIHFRFVLWLFNTSITFSLGSTRPWLRDRVEWNDLLLQQGPFQTCSHLLICPGWWQVLAPKPLFLGLVKACY